MSPRDELHPFGIVGVAVLIMAGTVLAALIAAGLALSVLRLALDGWTWAWATF
jgi:hypothetical protein